MKRPKRLKKNTRGQRARLNWIKYGDQNSKFFHVVTVQRMQRNRIVKIRDSNNIWLENEEEITNCFKDFFIDLFSSGYRDFSEALSFVKLVISEEFNQSLLRLVDFSKVKQVVFHLGKNKAYGPDGFPVISFNFLGRSSKIEFAKW